MWQRWVPWCILLVGCNRTPPPPPAPPIETTHMLDEKASDETLRQFDYRVLFVGNSHTAMHNLPNLVCRMIEHQHPGRTARAMHIVVPFLESTARDPRCREQLDRGVWQYVILQAQKISTSGKFDYSTQEGIDLAKYARTHNAKPFFYAEWGMQGIPNDGPRTERIYAEMATQSNAGLAPVGRAWDMALAQRPKLPLYDTDGNHQSSTGAFLTACVLYGRITGEDPTPLGAYPYLHLRKSDAQFLAACAAQALQAMK